MTTDLDTVLDRVQNILNQLGGIVDDIRAEHVEPVELTATVDLMTVGGWTKMPGRERWRKIANISHCVTPSLHDCWRIDFADNSRDGSFVHVDGYTPYPFLTAEQFDTACDRERVTQEDEAVRRSTRTEGRAA